MHWWSLTSNRGFQNKGTIGTSHINNPIKCTIFSQDTKENIMCPAMNNNYSNHLRQHQLLTFQKRAAILIGHVSLNTKCSIDSQPHHSQNPISQWHSQNSWTFFELTESNSYNHLLKPSGTIQFSPGVPYHHWWWWRLWLWWC